MQSGSVYSSDCLKGFLRKPNRVHQVIRRWTSKALNTQNCSWICPAQFADCLPRNETWSGFNIHWSFCLFLCSNQGGAGQVQHCIKDPQSLSLNIYTHVTRAPTTVCLRRDNLTVEQKKKRRWLWQQSYYPTGQTEHGAEPCHIEQTICPPSPIKGIASWRIGHSLPEKGLSLCKHGFSLIPQ